MCKLLVHSRSAMPPKEGPFGDLAGPVSSSHSTIQVMKLCTCSSIARTLLPLKFLPPDSLQKKLAHKPWLCGNTNSMKQPSWRKDCSLSLYIYIYKSLRSASSVSSLPQPGPQIRPFGPHSRSKDATRNTPSDPFCTCHISNQTFWPKKLESFLLLVVRTLLVAMPGAPSGPSSFFTLTCHLLETLVISCHRGHAGVSFGRRRKPPRRTLC